MINVTSSFSKRLVFKMFSFHFEERISEDGRLVEKIRYVFKFLWSSMDEISVIVPLIRTSILETFFKNRSCLSFKHIGRFVSPLSFD